MLSRVRDLFTGRRQFKHRALHLLGADVLGDGLARPHPGEHLAVVLGPGTSGRCQCGPRAFTAGAVSYLAL